jgi:hypothetical protein
VFLELVVQHRQYGDCDPKLEVLNKCLAPLNSTEIVVVIVKMISPGD